LTLLLSRALRLMQWNLISVVILKRSSMRLMTGPGLFGNDAAASRGEVDKHVEPGGCAWRLC
jgi:hypothetical protein